MKLSIKSPSFADTFALDVPPDCSLAACTGGCGGHGECTSPEECTCHSGWKGGDCMTPDCGEADCGEADGHGRCRAPTDTCYEIFFAYLLT